MWFSLLGKLACSVVLHESFMSTTKESNVQISESAANLGTSGRLGMAWPGPLVLGNPHSSGSVSIRESPKYFTGGGKTELLKKNGLFPNIFQSVIQFLSFSVSGVVSERTGAANPPGCALLCLELLFQEGMSRSGNPRSQISALAAQGLKTSQCENVRFKEQVKILNEWEL